LRTVAPATADALWALRRGTFVGVRQAHAPAARGRRAERDPGTRPSLSPKARARRSSLNSAGASRRGWRGRGGIAVGQTHASGRNRHRDHLERASRGSPRVFRTGRQLPVAARHVRKGRRLRPPSLRGIESSGWVARTSVCSCRSRQAALGLEYARARSSKKSHHGSERRPSPGQSSAVKRRRGSRAKRRRDVGRHRTNGARIGEGPG
jgi:hypothetical protein